jgi:hypothetical protein
MIVLQLSSTVFINIVTSWEEDNLPHASKINEMTIGPCCQEANVDWPPLKEKR